LLRRAMPAAAKPTPAAAFLQQTGNFTPKHTIYRGFRMARTAPEGAKKL
jgi:hypothetical protein